MKRLRLFLTIIIFSNAVYSDEILRVRPKSPVKLQPKKIVTQGDVEAEVRTHWSSPFYTSSAHFRLVTPLGSEYFPEKRFKAWGNVLAFSFYLGTIGESLYLQAQPGLGASLIRLSLTQPAVDFSHLFVHFPMRLRLAYALNSKSFIDGFLGFVWRPWENDSRQPPDGGFHRTEQNAFTLDAGFGTGLFLADNFFGELSLSVQWLSIGFGILL